MKGNWLIRLTADPGNAVPLVPAARRAGPQVLHSLIARVSRGAVRVGSREGMVFPAHLTMADLLLLAGLTDGVLHQLYARERYANRPGERPDPAALRPELSRIRRSGFAVNRGRSVRRLVAAGVPVRGLNRAALPGLAAAVPSIRYDRRQTESLQSALTPPRALWKTTFAC